jgi:hypothetical protein
MLNIPPIVELVPYWTMDVHLYRYKITSYAAFDSSSWISVEMNNVTSMIPQST